jgi:hypothetical protein
LTAGLDWQLYRHAGVYLRYISFDYEDKSTDQNSGTAHMALLAVCVLVRYIRALPLPPHIESEP